MALFLSSRRENHCTVVEMQGRLDNVTAAELHRCLDLLYAADQPPKRLALDLSGLDSCDVGGLGILVATRNRAARHAGELRVVCPEGQVLKTLQISHLMRVLPVFRTLDDAVTDRARVEPEHAGGETQ
ncbi:STAS domain-containing protein [Streptomyces sp. T-3]|nr:STAS domain-containing protein [Streptomyces sp. T-3]